VAIADAQREQESLRARYAKTSSRVAELEASARSDKLPPCAISDAAKNALEGL